MPFHKTVGELAALVQGEVVGDPQTVITGFNGIREAGPGDLTFLAQSRYADQLAHTRASAIVTSKAVTRAPKPLIRTDHPELAFARLVAAVTPAIEHGPVGVHPTAILGKDVRLGREVRIQAHVVLGDRVTIGDRAILYPGVMVGHDTTVGAETLIYAHVTLYPRVSIGRRVIIHSGTVIGNDGFGFARDMQGIHQKIPQLGTVIIEDDVELGAMNTVNRARFGVTRVGQGTKTDDHVHIAHNVVVGPHCLLVAQVGISGSAILGHHVTLAGQVGTQGHITIGDEVIVGGQAGVWKSLPANGMYSGVPARPHAETLRMQAAVARLPKLYEQVRQLQAKINALEAQGRGIPADTRKTR